MTLRRSPSSSVVNGAFAAAEFAAPQLALLMVAPLLLRHLGAARLGIWMLASAAISSGSLLSGGFGDAAVKYIAMYRGRGDQLGIARVVRSMLTINLSLGALLSLALWIVSPYAARHIAHLDAVNQALCIQCFRLGSLLLFLRSIDSVFASTLRALGHYAPATRIALCSRLGALLATALLAAGGRGVVAIMTATLAIAAAALIAQAVVFHVYAGNILLLPSLHRDTIRMIAGFGCFSWLQALAALAFSQADRIIVSVLLGAPAVAVYGICTQAAQPIHGVVAAAFHALFPRLSAGYEVEPTAQLRSVIVTAFQVNLTLAFAFAVPFLFFGRPALAAWMGQAVAAQGSSILSILAVAYAFLALNVTGHYALLAFGMVRQVTLLNLLAGAVMLAAMSVLARTYGMTGAACARLLYGPITWVMYSLLWRRLRTSAAEPLVPPMLVCEES